MELVYLGLGLLLGFVIAWVLAKQKLSQTPSYSNDFVAKTLYQEVQKANTDKEKEIRELGASLAKAEQWAEDVKLKLQEQKKEVSDLQELFRLEMSQYSNQLLEDKSKKFLELNDKRMTEILDPLKDRIKEFEQKVERNAKDSLAWNAALREQVKGLSEANAKMAEDAKRLTNALKGDKKQQGNWGEMQLELILEKAGLQKDIHYKKEVSLKNDYGKGYRPDFIINLPEDKHLVIDSKVSLVAYENYFNEEADDALKAVSLQNHLTALNKHITDLGNKNYQNLLGINTPDYVMLFVPIEPALNLALREDSTLFEKALAKNIVLVSTSTLLATLRTISYIWKQENQRKNVLEIAKESGALYDKFVGFIDDLSSIGKRIDGLNADYNEAMKKLVESPQKGSTIIGRIERLKKLGADTSKQIPKHLLDDTSSSV